jgi:hypothetical protein
MHTFPSSIFQILVISGKAIVTKAQEILCLDVGVKPRLETKINDRLCLTSVKGSPHLGIINNANL